MKPWSLATISAVTPRSSIRFASSEAMFGVTAHSALPLFSTDFATMRTASSTVGAGPLALLRDRPRSPRPRKKPSIPSTAVMASICSIASRSSIMAITVVVESDDS